MHHVLHVEAAYTLPIESVIADVAIRLKAYATALACRRSSNHIFHSRHLRFHAAGSFIRSIFYNILILSLRPGDVCASFHSLFNLSLVPT